MKYTRDVFSYLNYREFLRNYYQKRKRDHSYLSYRLLSEKGGFKSPNFIKLVAQGQRNLSKDGVYRCAKALGMNKKETEYFENLVFFNQSKTLEEKNYYLTRVMRMRKRVSVKKMELSQYQYYTQWYNPVVRELVTADDFGDDYEKLAAHVVPAITPQQAHKAVQLLEELDFIQKDEHGRYEKTDAFVSTGPQVRSVAVANYHKEMMRLASESIERYPAAQRDITSLTCSVSQETQELIIDKIKRVRMEIMELVEADQEKDRVVQVNFQLFPLSRDFHDEEGTS
jgi:uncharacterized protein (TIGR02147 family)